MKAIHVAYKSACITLGEERQILFSYKNTIPPEKKEWTFEQATKVEDLTANYNFARGQVAALEKLINIDLRDQY